MLGQSVIYSMDENKMQHITSAVVSDIGRVYKEEPVDRIINV